MKRLGLLLLSTLILAMPLAAQKRAFTIEDLYRLKGVSELDVSPDGRAIIFTVTISDFPKAKRTSSIWMADVDGRNVARAHRII